MTDGKTFVFPNALVGQAMQPIPLAQNAIGAEVNALNGIQNPLMQQAAIEQQQLLGQLQQRFGIQQSCTMASMAITRGAERALLLPGLTGVEGNYRRLAETRYVGLAQLRVEGMGWAAFDNAPGYVTVSAETAARSKDRARGLLRSLLSPEQWDEFEGLGKVKERIGGCEFTLTPGGMIEARKPRLVGSVKERWCIAPDPYADNNDFMPAEDKLIGQLLHLRAGPKKLRAQANIFAL